MNNIGKSCSKYSFGEVIIVGLMVENSVYSDNSAEPNQIIYAHKTNNIKYNFEHGFIIYKVMKYRKILMKYNVYFIFSLVKI